MAWLISVSSSGWKPAGGGLDVPLSIAPLASSPEATSTRRTDSDTRARRGFSVIVMLLMSPVAT